MLALSNPTQPDIDADDDVSDHSTSPERASHLTSTNGYALQHPIIAHARKVSSQSNTGFPIRDSFIKPNLDLILPATVEISRPSDESSIPNSLKPGVVGLPPLSDPMGLTFEDKPSKPPSKPLPPVPLPLSSASSEDSFRLDVQDAASIPKANQLHTSPDRPTVLMYSSTPALTLGSGTGHSSHIQESPKTLRDLPRQGRLGPKLTLDTTMDVNINTTCPGSAINTSSSQQPPFPPVPRRTLSSAAPRLSIPPANYRFSLNLVDGHSARLSPSVILRPPPLPLLNLPVLSRSTTTSVGSIRRSKRAGLMSMPALPRHGSTRGVAGHEEPDNIEDEDEDEDEGDGDDVDNHSTSPDSAPLEDDEADTPQSGYSSAAETISGRRSHSRSLSTSSYETAHNESSTTLHAHNTSFGDPPRIPDKTSYLPPVDISRIDLSFLDLPPLDKGKNKELTEDAGRTPTATKRSNRKSVTPSTPTMFRRMQSFIPEEPKTDIWAASPVIAKGGQPSSPIQTPRPGGYFNFPVRVPTPPSPPIHTRSTTENRLSVLSMNTTTQFPGNLRASRSLIDIHASEKKEKVEQMVREEEEGAEEERKRRVKSMRRSMRVEVVDATKASVVDQQPSGDAESKTSPRSAVSPGVSFTSHWAHGDVNENDHSGSGEASSPKKQPKKSNNRISMAPAYETILPLRRRLSMPTFNSTTTPPPPYPDLFPQPYGVKPAQIQPRDDEGREKLPAYSNSIYLKAIMPRKIEFSQPGVLSKDRKWKRVLCVLEGTSFKIYKPPGVSAIGGWWESKVGVGNIVTPASTNTSSNVAGGTQRASGGGMGWVPVEGRVREEKKVGGNMMAIQTPSQSDNANRRQVHIPTTASSSYSSSGPGHGLPRTKSALNLAVHLLIPSSRGHGRTISDVGQPSNSPSALRSPRSSLNIPRNGRITPTPTIDSMTTGTSSSSSRSLSPMFAASSSSLSTTSASSMGSGRSATSRTVTNNYPAGAASTSSSFMSKGKKKAEDSSPDEHTLIKAYTMQQAESGLGSDYVKRKNVIRVRLEGEQFLLQAGDVDSVIDWIEVSLFSFGGVFFGGSIC